MTRAYRDASEPEGSMTNPSEAMIKEAVALFRSFCRGLESNNAHRWSAESSEHAIVEFCAAMTQAATPAAPVQDDDAEFDVGEGLGKIISADEGKALLDAYASGCRVGAAPLVEALRRLLDALPMLDPDELEAAADQADTALRDGGFDA